jgi:hypothetical protein
VSAAEPAMSPRGDRGAQRAESSHARAAAASSSQLHASPESPPAGLLRIRTSLPGLDGAHPGLSAISHSIGSPCMQPRYAMTTARTLAAPAMRPAGPRMAAGENFLILANSPRRPRRHAGPGDEIGRRRQPPSDRSSDPVSASQAGRLVCIAYERYSRRRRITRTWPVAAFCPVIWPNRTPFRQPGLSARSC